ncbi:MAG: HAD family hydrolase [Deltaproteobacteria bacterium]|nr:HAD family hydrolase [Deltaproteobacteria bacterium]
MICQKKALLLDMNGTFMFGEDRFGDVEDFSIHYRQLGGTLPREDVNQIIRLAYAFLGTRYTDPRYKHTFPSVADAIRRTSPQLLDNDELKTVVNTFAYHELGTVPPQYVIALNRLHDRFLLGAVIDIWSPKSLWLETFEHTQIASLFSAISFSSDHGIVKPSPEPFKKVLAEIGVSQKEAIMVGDSPQRDLGGAQNAGIDCVLVGGAKHPDALACYNSLLELSDIL